MFFVYAIYNEARDKIYIGQTADLESRMERHNGMLKNKTKSFTSKNSGNWVLFHKEEFKTRGEVMQREKQLKSFQGRQFLRGLLKK